MSVDFQSPIVKYFRENKHIMVWTDHFTKYIEMKATTDQTAQTVAKLYAVCIFHHYVASCSSINKWAKNFLSAVVKQINRPL